MEHYFNYPIINFKVIGTNIKEIYREIYSSLLNIDTSDMENIDVKNNSEIKKFFKNKYSSLGSITDNIFLLKIIEAKRKIQNHRAIDSTFNNQNRVRSYVILILKLEKENEKNIKEPQFLICTDHMGNESKEASSKKIAEYINKVNKETVKLFNQKMTAYQISNKWDYLINRTLTTIIREKFHFASIFCIWDNSSKLYEFKETLATYELFHYKLKENK